MKLALPRANNLRARANGSRVVLDRLPRSATAASPNDGAAISTRTAHGSADIAHLNDKAAAPGKARPRAARKDEWRPIATFVVEFELRGGDEAPAERRTRAHHHEAMLDKSWAGFVRVELCDWIAAQLQGQLDSVYAQQAQGVARRAQEQPGSPATDWHLDGVRLCRAGNAAPIAMPYDRGRCTPALLAAGSPFVIELELARSATGSHALAQVHGYRVRAHNRDTRSNLELGSAPLVDHDHASRKTLSLNVSALTIPGSYRLECVPLTADGALDTAVIAIPLLQIV